MAVIEPLDRLVHRLIDQDLDPMATAECLQPLCPVYGLSDDRKLLPRHRADISRDDGALSDADVNAELGVSGGSAQGVQAHPFMHLERRPHRGPWSIGQ